MDFRLSENLILKITENIYNMIEFSQKTQNQPSP